MTAAAGPYLYVQSMLIDDDGEFHPDWQRIGDTINDMRAAKSVPMTVVAVDLKEDLLSELPEALDKQDALDDLAIEWHGKSAHAAVAPWAGRSALHASEVFTTAANGMREQMLPSCRLHYYMMEGPRAVNTIPDYVKLMVRFRAADTETVAEYMARAGFDAVMIHGISSEPVWIDIAEDGAQFHPAGDLWGQETYDTEDRVKAWMKELPSVRSWRDSPV